MNIIETAIQGRKMSAYAGFRAKALAREINKKKRGSGAKCPLNLVVCLPMGPLR